jgi:hypothetical protein
MTATARLKQLLFIAAALALVGLGLVAAVSTASPARAEGTAPCVETDDGYTEWSNVGDQIRTEENVPPGSDTDTTRYVFVGETEPEGNGDGTDDTVVADGFQRYSLTGGAWGAGTPSFPNPGDPFRWVANVKGDPHGIGQAGAYSVSNGQSGNTDWFYLEAITKTVPGQPETFDTDYLWQKQVRTFVPGTECPPPGPDCEANPQAEGCPPVDSGKKVVVCKYVGTPPGQLDHIVIVSENTLNNLVDGNGDPFSGQFPFSWTDAQGQTTNGSIAIRYATDGEQAQDVALSECPADQPDEVCPEGTDHAGDPFPVEGDETSCNDADQEICPEGTDHAGDPFPVEGDETSCNDFEPGPGTCPEGTDKAGEAIPADKTEEEFCDDDDDEVCPRGTDHAGDEVKHGDDPSKVCDDDDNHPNNPGEPNGPSNHPNPGPTVKGAQASVPNSSTSTSPSAPTVKGAQAAARVPTAVDAGLGPAQRDLTGNGGPLGLLGIATALVGAVLVGASLRPRRGRSLTG